MIHRRRPSKWHPVPSRFADRETVHDVSERLSTMSPVYTGSARGKGRQRRQSSPFTANGCGNSRSLIARGEEFANLAPSRVKRPKRARIDPTTGRTRSRRLQRLIRGRHRLREAKRFEQPGAQGLQECRERGDAIIADRKQLQRVRLPESLRPSNRNKDRTPARHLRRSA